MYAHIHVSSRTIGAGLTYRMHAFVRVFAPKESGIYSLMIDHSCLPLEMFPMFPASPASWAITRAVLQIGTNQRPIPKLGVLDNGWS